MKIATIAITATAVMLLTILITACAPKTPEPTTTTTTTTTEEFPKGLTTTVDGYSIAYTLYPNPGKPAVILLHMLRKTRADYHTFAQRLKDEGYFAITIDSRGHGQSSGKWQSFSDEDFKGMVSDVAAAKALLEEKGADVSKIAIIGASIGANVALNYAAKDPAVKTVVALSPGLDFHSVKTEQPMKELSSPVLLVASSEDSYSADTVNELEKLAPKGSQKIIYTNKGHGTEMFKGTDLDETILDWFYDHVR